MPNIFWKHKDAIMFFSQLLILIGSLIFTSLISAGWDYKKVNYIVFGMMTFYSIYAKAISTNYAFSMELRPKPDSELKETNEILILEKYIIDTHHLLINENRAVRFNRALVYRNYTYRLRNEMLRIDMKCNKSYSKRVKYAPLQKIMRDMLQLLESYDYSEFDRMSNEPETLKLINIKKVSRASMHRSNVKMTSIFNTKASKIEDTLDGGASSLIFNRWTYAFKTQLVFLILMPILQIIFTGITVNNYVSSMQIWLDFIGYILSISIALFNGFRIGTDAAKNGYIPVLQERVKVIQEVMNIEKKIKPEA